MKAIRGGMGLGDALYVQAVARHLVNKGERLEVCNAWPDVFRPLGDAVRVTPFRRNNIHYLAHYSMRKRQSTTQFKDCCIQAGITEPVELKLDWQVNDVGLAYGLKQSGKPLVLVQLPRNPMNRKDGFGKELLPNCRVIQDIIDALRGQAKIVLVGSGKPLFEFQGIDVDLSNKTSVRQLLDVAAVADSFLGHCSFFVPLSESLDRPGFFVWSRKGLKARHPYISRITPQKILEKRSSRYAIDDRPDTDAAIRHLLQSRAGAEPDRGKADCAGGIGAGSGGEPAGVC